MRETEPCASTPRCKCSDRHAALGSQTVTFCYGSARIAAFGNKIVSGSGVNQWLTRQPSGTPGIERLDRRPFEARHVALDGVADPRLEIGQVAVALGKLRQEALVQRQ